MVNKDMMLIGGIGLLLVFSSALAPKNENEDTGSTSGYNPYLSMQEAGASAQPGQPIYYSLSAPVFPKIQIPSFNSIATETKKSVSAGPAPTINNKFLSSPLASNKLLTTTQTDLNTQLLKTGYAGNPGKHMTSEGIIPPKKDIKLYK